MQRLLDLVSHDQEKELVFEAIKNDIAKLAFHEMGNYVLLQLIPMFSQEKVDAIIEVLLPSTIDLAKNSFGICILNKLIERTKLESHLLHYVEIFCSDIIDIT